MKRVLALFVLAPLLIVNPARAADEAAIATCAQNDNASIKTIDEQLKAFGIDPTNPCPEQDGFDGERRNCKKEVDNMRKFDDQLRAMSAEKCGVAAELRALPSSADAGEQKTSQDLASQLTQKASRISNAQVAKIEEIRASLKKIRKMQLEIADGARSVQKQAEENAKLNAEGTDNHTAGLSKAAEHRGGKVTNNRDAAAFFKDAIGSISGLVDKAQRSLLTLDDVKKVKTPLTREPLAVIAAADDWDKQMVARQAVLKSQGGYFDASAFTTDGNGARLGENGTGTGTGNGSGSNNSSGGGDSDTLGNTSKLLGATSGLTSLAGGGTSSAASTSGTGPLAADAANAYPTLAGANTGATAGANDPAAAANAVSSLANNATGGTTTNGATNVATNGSTTYAPGTGSSAATSTLGAGSLASTGASGQSSAGGNEIKNLNSVLASNADGKPLTSATGASTGRGSALRDSLRSKIDAQANATGSSSSTGASTGGGGGALGAAAAPASAAAVEAAATDTGASPADEALAAALGANHADTGNSNFSLAGNDTDAAVKGLLKEFDADGASGAEASRGPASISAVKPAPEILGAETRDLFARTRETHLRSLKKGLVINGLRSQLAVRLTN